MVHQGSTLRRRAREFDRQQRAFDLVLSGASYSQVANTPWPCRKPHVEVDPDCSRCHLYYDAKGAHRAVQRFMAAERELSQDRIAELREQQLARLRRARLGLWKQVLQGETDAVRAYVRLEEREAKLMGYDAPAKVQVTDQLDSEIETLMAQLASMPKQPAGGAA